MKPFVLSETEGRGEGVGRERGREGKEGEGGRRGGIIPCRS